MFAADGATTDDQTQLFSTFPGGNNTNSYLQVYFPVTMRAKPEVTYKTTSYGATQGLVTTNFAQWYNTNTHAAIKLPFTANAEL
jgi:hypothetical protein